jgi:hypothetical protein
MARQLTPQKWERKTAQAGAKWKAAVSNGRSPCQRLREEYGIQNCNIDQAWRAGVDAVTAGDFQSAISGKGPKWMENYVRGLASG